MHVLCDVQIVMQVIVAFILEAFVFRIQYRMVMNGQDMNGMVLLHYNSIIFWIESLHWTFSAITSTRTEQTLVYVAVG